jgi:hypothetical protein
MPPGFRLIEGHWLERNQELPRSGPRRREAVSGILPQTGCKTPSTTAASGRAEPGFALLSGEGIEKRPALRDTGRGACDGELEVPPSACRPGFFIAATVRAVSLFSCLAMFRLIRLS